MPKDDILDATSPSLEALLDNYANGDALRNVFSPINLLTSFQTDFQSNCIVSRDPILPNPKLAGLGILNPEQNISQGTRNDENLLKNTSSNSGRQLWSVAAGVQAERESKYRHSHNLSGSSGMDHSLTTISSQPNSLNSDFDSFASDSFGFSSLSSDMFSLTESAGIKAPHDPFSFFSLNTSESYGHLGPIADFSMFDKTRNAISDVGVNPVDIMGPYPSMTSLMDEDELIVPASRPPISDIKEEEDSDPFSQEAIQSFFQIIETDRATKTGHCRGSTTSSSESLHTASQLRSHSDVTTVSRPRILRAHTAPAHTSSTQSRSRIPQIQPLLLNMPDDARLPDTPILNAHLGIDIEMVRARAEAYRQRYPGFEIDKKWLMVYAGKLSERGELLDDYRCYVSGCTQVNKRRDHILVHVGSHVDQRPFQCSQCLLRFLRKNECKRHEAGHMGNRPFVCDLCPEHDIKTFVRQDLMKRHLKRSHGYDEMVGPRPAKRTRVMSY